MAHAPVELAAVVQQALDTLRVVGHSDQHTMKTHLEPVTVLGDATRIEQIVSNLLVNALKYTDRGGQIDVEVTAEGADAVLRVRDTGIGISAEMLPRLFELFSQGGQALDRSKGGLGIGLTLVRRLAELHGGRVEAASEGPGRGSVFTVRLPRAAAVSVPGGAPAAPRVPTATSLRVLVVEDNDDARDMLLTVLRLAGHEAHEAADGVAALRVAADVRPHVALIDLGLPGLDGLEVAARLRGRPDADPPLLVAVTGYGQAADRQRTEHAGFDLHLTKPVDPDRLTEVVAEAARRWLARAET
jgi:CheY-like chemotaxis protein/anti-sigma regulatory factor (Ser/Thr protein kinase)